MACFTSVCQHRDECERLIKWLWRWKPAGLWWLLCMGSVWSHEVGQDVREYVKLPMSRFFCVTTHLAKCIYIKAQIKAWFTWTMTISAIITSCCLDSKTIVYVELFMCSDPNTLQIKDSNSVPVHIKSFQFPQLSAADPSWHFSAGVQQASCLWQTGILQL